MSDYVVVGKKGNGKTLCVVSRLREFYLARGRRVATNIDLNLAAMGFRRDVSYVRLPDFPDAEALLSLGRAYEGKYNERKFGAIALDEAGIWANARNWNDKSRASLQEVLRQLRKLGWDLYLIVQDDDSLDRQLRGTCQEYTVHCLNLGRLRLLGFGLPRFFIARVWYGNYRGADSFRVDRWTSLGWTAYKWYDTEQVFGPVKESRVVSYSPPPQPTVGQVASWCVSWLAAAVLRLPLELAARELGLVKGSERAAPAPFYARCRRNGFSAREEHFVVRLPGRPSPAFLIVDGGVQTFQKATARRAGRRVVARF